MKSDGPIEVLKTAEQRKQLGYPDDAHWNVQMAGRKIAVLKYSGSFSETQLRKLVSDIENSLPGFSVILIPQGCDLEIIGDEALPR